MAVSDCSNIISTGGAVRRGGEGEAPGGGGGAEDKVSCGAAGGDADEEAGDQAAALRGARDHHGQGEGGARVPEAAAHTGAYRVR